MSRLLLLLLLVFAVGCSSGGNDKDQAELDESAEEEVSENDSPEPNVIREYVNTPKDKARGVGKKLEGQQAKTAEQARSLAED